jgi:dihydrofolate synthase/folylpolyglutamate synthase
VSRTLTEWLELQERVHVRSIDLGLERVSQVARTLGLAKPSYRIITVAGTNGKGSTVAYLDGLLRALGHRSGALTSPHLIRYNERIHIDGAEADDAALIGAFERIEQARGATTLTFFEYNTLAGLLLFADRDVDVAVLEVGLGGRLDATNIVDADVAVLCSIGLDHRDWLGDTLEEIGAEKAGIFRAGRPAVLGHPKMPASVHAAIERLGARAIRAEREFLWELEGQHWSYRGLGTTLRDLPAPALAGAVQYRNAATALAALEALGISVAQVGAVGEALRSVRLLGRFQIIPGPVEWILDVAHNEPAAQVLAHNLRARPHRGRTLAVSGILTDKDAPAIGRALQDDVDDWIVCALPGPRGSSAAETAQRLGPVHAVMLAQSVAEGCARARERARPDDRVVVFGSFVTVGSALEWLGLY